MGVTITLIGIAPRPGKIKPEKKTRKSWKREEELKVGNINSVDTVPSEMTLRLKKAVKYYGTSRKPVLKVFL